MSQTLGAIRLDERSIVKEVGEDAWGRVMVGALGYVGTEQTLPALYKYLSEFRSEEAKKDVCSAIGNILAKTPDQLLPNFLSKASHEKDIYLSLVMLREMLGFTHKAFGTLGQLIEWLFTKS